jgi:hypothetical protein
MMDITLGVLQFALFVLLGFVYREQGNHIVALNEQNKLLDRQNAVLIELIESLRDDPNAF